jgi:hypothetical protein
VIPFGLKIPVDSAVVLPRGGLVLGVDAVTDFEARGRADDQARDPETGLRVWLVSVADLEEQDAQTKFRGSWELKVRMFAETRPQPPESQVPGMPPLVAFTGLTLSPYVDSTRCGPGNRETRCRGRLAYSLRATGMVPFHAGATAAAVKKAA